MIRIGLADDHVVFRSGLKALLEGHPDFCVVSQAGSGPDVLTQMRGTVVDVLILDLTMPGGISGPLLVEELLRQYPRTHVVVLTMHEDPYYVREMFRVGVRAYVLKKSAIEDVVHAVRATMCGELYVDPSLGALALSSLVAPAARPPEGRITLLTPREREVCRLLALGYTNAEAGRQLAISDRTVESHRTSIMSKLDLRNRAELVRFALDNGLLG